MPKLIMCKGLPGSGKSTWAKEELLKYPVNSYKRVNKDDLRNMLDLGRWSKGAEDIVLQVRDHIIYTALQNGHNVIVDDTNLDPKHEERLREIAKEMDAELHIKFFDVELDECIRRNEARLESVPRDVILDMHRRYLSDEHSIRNQ